MGSWRGPRNDCEECQDVATRRMLGLAICTVHIIIEFYNECNLRMVESIHLIHPQRYREQEMTG